MFFVLLALYFTIESVWFYLGFRRFFLASIACKSCTLSYFITFAVTPSFFPATYPKGPMPLWKETNVQKNEMHS